MFDFFGMAGSYDERCIGRDEFDWGFISTAAVNDGEKLYETAVQHDQYIDSSGASTKMVVVEAYDTVAEAKLGHAKWIETMTNNPPDVLKECLNAEIAGLADSFGAELDQRRKK